VVIMSAMVAIFMKPASRTLDYTLQPLTANPHPAFACYYPGHYEANMKLEVMANQ